MERTSRWRASAAAPRGLRVLAIAAVALAAGASAAAAGPTEETVDTPFEQAREEAGVDRGPRTLYRLPAGELRVTSELLAAQSGQKIRFGVSLDRPARGGTLVVTLPARWFERYASRLPTVRGPRLAGPSAGAARVSRSGRTVSLTLEGAEAAFEITDVGIPAGDYRLPFRWRDRLGRSSSAGAARISLYAPVREELVTNPFARLIPPGTEVEATPGDSVEQSETFVTVSPFQSERILASANSISSARPNDVAFLSSDGGQSWKTLTIPNTVDAPGKASPEQGDYCCDPMSAADHLGNIWFGGLSFAAGADNPSRMFVNRIAARSDTFQPQTVGLPLLESGPNNSAANAGQQDKNMMTIDNSRSSPTYGRLYVVWNDTGGGNQVVISYCDTRVAGLPEPARCDNADNWTKPAPVSDRGSVIYADPAVGPDGKVYVAWWDFSSRNAIVGAVCDPTSADCATEAGYSETADIATLNDDLLGVPNSGEPLPFACPIPAQPGGRPGPATGIDVDISNGPHRGRVYVSWADLRPRSGTRRCEQVVSPGTPPGPDQLTWDAFIDSAPGALPAPSDPQQTDSYSVGTRLYTDEQSPPEADNTGRTGSNNSDEWFSWLAVDQSTGQAYADFYSTRDTPATDRRTTHFYLREVHPDPDAPGGQSLGQLTRVSTRASDYSTGTTACCVFGNDYGDYTGLDAAEGFPYPVWTRRDNATDDGDVYLFVPPASLDLVLQSAAVTEGPGADGDGQIEPGEPIVIFVTVSNPSAVGATNVTGTLESLTPQASVTEASSPYPDIGPGGSASNVVAFGARLGPDIPCGGNADFRVALRTDQGPESVVFMVPACSPAAREPDGGSSTPERTGGRRFLISRRALALTRRGVARVRVSCRQTTPCRGVLRLRATHRPRRGRGVRRLIVGRREFVVPARRRAVLPIRITRTGRRVLQRSPRRRILAIANVRPEARVAGSRPSTTVASFRLSPRR